MRARSNSVTAKTPGRQGFPYRIEHDGAIIYVQGPDERGSAYLRVVPNWVAQMKAAVDGAGTR